MSTRENPDDHINDLIEYLHNEKTEHLINHILPYLYIDELQSICNKDEILNSLCNNPEIWRLRLLKEYPYYNLSNITDYKTIYFNLLKIDTIPVYINGDISGYIHLSEDYGYKNLVDRMGYENCFVFLMDDMFLPLIYYIINDGILYNYTSIPSDIIIHHKIKTDEKIRKVLITPVHMNEMENMHGNLIPLSNYCKKYLLSSTSIPYYAYYKNSDIMIIMDNNEVNIEKLQSKDLHIISSNIQTNEDMLRYLDNIGHVFGCSVSYMSSCIEGIENLKI
ncbi:Hypothetical protein ORPV_373 [Orpheovirus IHUMI-LCC2]|uniref:Uncharacterized protein n=1 Tax=Orpheovirus IHUMI-LCC2 TaxID=2023057 RepID=A0A2I2L431_9VIRU|nr:Hypothetical protein ORPV_373 [Orpheovirus IHUMI-LCC2]SNW62277.1 Hypothetical protein ORPV_373 [Orpheovirus IHUMI-LCC2]